MRPLFLLLLFVLPLFCDHEILESHDSLKEEHIPKNLQALDLNAKQHQQLKLILQEHRHKLMSLHQEEEKLEETLRQFFVSERFDKDTFLSQKESLKLKMATIETDFFLKLHQLFSPDQRKVFVRYIEEWEVE